MNYIAFFGLSSRQKRI